MTSDDWDAYDEYDESDVRVRANRHGTRPRSKVRPKHEDAVPGMVVAVDRGRYRVALDPPANRTDAPANRTEASSRAAAATSAADEVVGDRGRGRASAVRPAPLIVTAALARELGRERVIVGDRVGLVGDTSGAPGALARIVRVEPRRALLRRSADDAPTGERDERPIVANADVLLIVVAAADPEPRPRLVDRYLVAAVDVGIEPVLIMTKTDLADPGPFLEQFAGLDVRALRSEREHPPVDEIRELASGRLVVLVGHSGVGKSTLVNALVPDAERATGDVNAVTGRGRHTSSSTRAFPLGTGWIVDTPGVRSFGLGHVDPAHLLRAFPDLETIADDPETGCPRGCSHLPDAPDCALNEAVTEGRLPAARLESFQRLLAALGAR